MRDVLLRDLMGLFPDYVAVTGTVADSTTDFQPPVGEVWVLAWLRGSHDDTGGARDCSWLINQATNTALMMTPVSTANGVYRFFYTDVPIPEFLVLTNDCYLTFQVASIAAGKKATLHGFVYKLRGVDLDAVT